MGNGGRPDRHPGVARADASRRTAGTSDLWGYLAFSHGWTWLFWAIVIARGTDVWASAASIALLAVGGLGVPVGGIVMTWRTEGGEGLRALLRRLIDPGRISGWWWAVVLLLYPAVKLGSVALALALGTVDEPVQLEQASALLGRPDELLLYAGFVFLLGPLPEEIGWRGYLLDRLQRRFTALGASLLVGIAWFSWHIPLFLMAGYYTRAGGAPDPVRFSVMIVLGSILYTWIHNNNGGSVLAAVLFHFSGNLSGELLDVPEAVAAYESYLTAAVVLFVLWRWGGGTLTGSTSTDVAPRGSGVGRSKCSLGSQPPSHENTRRDNS